MSNVQSMLCIILYYTIWYHYAIKLIQGLVHVHINSFSRERLDAEFYIRPDIEYLVNYPVVIGFLVNWISGYPNIQPDTGFVIWTDTMNKKAGYLVRPSILSWSQRKDTKERRELWLVFPASFYLVFIYLFHIIT